MKNHLAFLFCGLFLMLQAAVAQTSRVDSLVNEIQGAKGILSHKTLLNQIYAIPGGDSILLKRGQTALVKSEATGNTTDREHALLLICYANFKISNRPALLEACIKGIRLSSATDDGFYLARFQHMAAMAYVNTGDDRKSTEYSLQAAKTAMTIKDTLEALENYSNVESDYAVLKNADSALFYAKFELKLATALKKKDKRLLYSTVFADIGEAFTIARRPDSALAYDRRSYNAAKTIPLEDNDSFPYLLNNMAEIFLQLGRPDSALVYARQGYDKALKIGRWDFVDDLLLTLVKLYDGKDDRKELFYLKAEIAARDSVNAAGASRQLQLINDKEQERIRDLKSQRDQFNARVRLYGVIAAAGILLAIGITLWRNNRKQKHTNLLLSEQKEEISAQRDELGHTLEQLKATQTQLIQSEKMASLGELTAGIAHEIQNPLNFVNNFSEVNQEMIDELEEELNAGNIEEALGIAAGIKQNEQKISHHGKRADGIVKGMLQHSRTSTGEKQLTNINVLADEFLKLSYHGLRAKDKNFNAELVTNFDPDLPPVHIVKQDIGRVLLNLFNNAFYAVAQKAKTADPGYKPTVEFTTLLEGDQIAISVKDNGMGIPDAIKEKIMQPFFTTKPTGEGTGLGLSLSYDIVVKGHGGSIQVDSVEGEGSEFIIQLPIKVNPE
jgi:signal transduction histidine kinase